MILSLPLKTLMLQGPNANRDFYLSFEGINEGVYNDNQRVCVAVSKG